MPDAPRSCVDVAARGRARRRREAGEAASELSVRLTRAPGSMGLEIYFNGVKVGATDVEPKSLSGSAYVPHEALDQSFLSLSNHCSS